MAIVRLAFTLCYLTCLLTASPAEDQYAPSPPAGDRVRREPTKDQSIDAIFSRNDDQHGENIRKERSYYLKVETPASIISLWRPPIYRLPRPYFIPVYGAEGAIPIYFPPQPLYIHAGYPLDNPPYRPYPSKPDQGYLPAKPDEQDQMDLGNRFGEDGPVWDRIPARPAQPQPTRRPSASRTTTPFPPLVHNEPVTEPTNQISNREGGAPAGTTPRPSQCVWAIVNCCAADSESVNNRCFERFGCPGPFWDKSPCDSNFARVAIQSALNYYGDK